MPSNMLINNRTASTLLVGDVIAERAYYGSSEVFIAPEDDFDPDAATYIAAVEAADEQTLEEGVKQAIDGFVTGCKADGIWDAIKASCILAGARTLNGALVPLAGDAPTNFNFVSADYDRVMGLKGDGSTKDLDSNYAFPSENLKNAHGAVFRTEPEGFSTEALFGNRSGTGDQFSALVTSDRRFYRAFYAPGGDVTDDTRHTGLVGVSRNLLSKHDYIYNGIVGTISKEALDVSTNTVTVFSRDGDNQSNARISYYGFGEHVNLTNIDARVSTLMEEIEAALT